MKLVQAGNSSADVSVQGEARADSRAGAGCCGEKHRWGGKAPGLSPEDLHHSSESTELLHRGGSGAVSGAHHGDEAGGLGLRKVRSVAEGWEVL